MWENMKMQGKTEREISKKLWRKINFDYFQNNISPL